MKAQIFSLRDQDGARRVIEASLRRDFYQGIMVDHIIYDDKDKGDARRTGGSYLRLLKASTITVGDFTIESEDAAGNWGYYWDDSLVKKHFLRLSDELKTGVFPAVAIMDRMVMVPLGIHRAIDAPTDFSYLFRPLDLHGVLLVDFEDGEAIRRAILRVGARIRAEIVSLGLRQMSLQRALAPDLEDLGQLLDVDLDFLQDLKQEILRPLPHLMPRVISEPVRLLRESRVTVEIRNESDYTLGAVRVQIRAPRRVMEAPLVRHLDFSLEGAANQSIEFEVVPQTIPFCPLEVLVLLDDSTYEPMPPIPLILRVLEN